VTPQSVIDDAFLGGNPFTFDAERAAALCRPAIDQAASEGAVAVISHEPLSGLPTLNGFDSQLLADRLHSTLPDARILIGIREQRSMMTAVYKQYVTTSGTQPVTRLWREREPWERQRPSPGLEVFEYHHLIAYYQRAFGKDRVLVLPFEGLQADAKGFANAICSFAGVPAPVDLPTTEANPSNPALLVSLVRYSNLLLRAFGLVASSDGPVTRETLRYARYRTIDGLRPLFKPLSSPFERRLSRTIDRLADQRFGSSNAITAEITGLDLASYGYDLDIRARAQST
jgi:hypothetical protein